MTGLEHYPPGCNAFHMAPPKGAGKPHKPPRKRIKLTTAQQAAIALETPEERTARQLAEVTAFHPFAGIADFGVKPDHMAIQTKKSKLTGKRINLERDA